MLLKIEIAKNHAFEQVYGGKREFFGEIIGERKVRFPIDILPRNVAHMGNISLQFLESENRNFLRQQILKTEEIFYRWLLRNYKFLS
jgi:hypothetical protein